jgi:hypothetical protein
VTGCIRLSDARPATRIQRFKDSKIRGFKDSRIQRFKDSRIQGFKDSSIEGIKDEIYENANKNCRLSHLYLIPFLL